MKKKAATKDELAHMEATKRLPCCICGKPGPSATHHTGIKMGLAKNHYSVVPLCFSHHQGETGFHTLGRKAFERLHATTEEQMVLKTEGMLYDLS